MGFDASDVLGRELNDIFTQEDCDAGIPRLELETAARMGRAADERWHVRKDGSRFWGLGAVTRDSRARTARCSASARSSRIAPI